MSCPAGYSRHYYNDDGLCTHCGQPSREKAWDIDTTEAAKRYPPGTKWLDVFLRASGASTALFLITAARADVILSIDDKPVPVSLLTPMPDGYLSTSRRPTLITHADSQSIAGGEYLPFGDMQYDYVNSGPVKSTNVSPSPWSFELQDDGWGWLINVDGSSEPDYTVVGTVTGGFDLLDEMIAAPKFDAFGDLHNVPMNPAGFYQVTGMESVASPSIISSPEPATLAILSLVILKRK